QGGRGRGGGDGRTRKLRAGGHALEGFPPPERRWSHARRALLRIGSEGTSLASRAGGTASPSQRGLSQCFGTETGGAFPRGAPCLREAPVVHLDRVQSAVRR